MVVESLPVVPSGGSPLTPRAAASLAATWGDSAACSPVSPTRKSLEPDEGLIGIGSGGSYALAAAQALHDLDGLGAEDIARKAMDIAAGICVYTNTNLTIESLSEGE